MQIDAIATLMAMAASVAVAMAPASAQPTASAMEQVLEPGRPGAFVVVEPAPAPVTTHGSAPSHNVMSPPPVCRIRSDEECHHVAAACLKARNIGGLYSVARGAEGQPAVIRIRDDMSDKQEQYARACATDLEQCLSGNC
ncbi:MAG: hypothetical protein KKC43_00660 [Alphaproteobacteria bacterium]|nr:hypothetical protein [Alphaproteobacteria bacterium]